MFPGRTGDDDYIRDAPGVMSPCIDTGDPSSYYGSETTPRGSRINMGAYGNTREASLSGPRFGGSVISYK